MYYIIELMYINSFIKLKKKLIEKNNLPKSFLKFEFSHFNFIDHKKFISLRNKKNVSKFFFNPNKISLKNHYKYLANYNSKPILNLVLITKRSKKIVGNFSIKKTVIGYEIGKMILNNKYLCKGIARQGSIKLLEYYFKYIKERKILSKTKINNRANINLNTKLGFIISKKNNDYYIMELSYVRFHNFCYKKKF